MGIPAAREPIKFNAHSPILMNRSYTRLGGADVSGGAAMFNNKKRDFTELNHTFNQPRQLTPAQNTPFYTFEDSSTVKPNDNTIIRNPTLLLKYAQDKSQTLNRSVHIKPVNLGRLEFDRDQQDAESNYVSARATPLTKPRNETKEFTTKEIADFCMRVSIIVNDMMKSEVSPKVTDIAQNQSEGKLYEVLPHLFAVTNSYKLPQVIKREINEQSIRPSTYVDYGFLDESSTAYFCFDRNLYLWSFPEPQSADYQFTRHNPDIVPLKQEFEQMVTAVSLAVPLPGMDFKNADSRILIVSTVTEIKIYNFIKNTRDGRIELLDTNFSVPSDDNVVSKIIQCKKNGRVFYGGSSGRVHELRFQDSSQFDIFSLLQGEKKKLKKNDLQQENLIRKILPGFLKFTDTKSLIDIKIDEHRNVLFSVCMSLDQQTMNETIIEVFDLGILSNKFHKIATLRQHQIVEMMFEFWQRDNNLHRQEYSPQDFKIIYAQPISLAESQHWHLMLVTQNGYRIYIHFEQDEVPLPTDEELKREGAVADYLFTRRFTSRWRIEEIMHFPEEETFEELQFMGKLTSPISAGSVTSIAQKLNNDASTLLYDSQDGIFTFVQSNKDTGRNDPLSIDANNRIVLNFIKRNESSFAYNRLVNESSVKEDFCRLIEQLSQLQIPLERVMVRNHTPNAQRDDHYDYMPENVIELQSIKRVASQEIGKLIGMKKTYLENRGIESYKIFDTLAISEFEKQVYLQAPIVNVLTDNRVIEVQQIRPIDTLAMLIHAMTTDTRTLYQQYDNLEEYLETYTVRETCSMLLQIIIESNAQYTFSRKIEDGLKQVKKQDQFLSQPSQIMSKSQQILRNRRGSLMDNSGYLSKVSQIDVIRHRTLTTEERQTALSLYKKYGDSIVFIKQTYDITEDALNGTPQNNQDFSIKHFALYQYLQRVMRPLWNTKLAYRLPNQADQWFKASFQSLNTPRKKLIDLFEFIDSHDIILRGQTYSPNPKMGSEDTFVRNINVLNIIQPVYKLSNSDKDKLEIMEKNSLQNLQFFITRCIQGIDMLGLLTLTGEPSVFTAVQKAVNDIEAVSQFADYTFKDLVTSESNVLIKRFLEAAVKVETNDSDDSHQILRQKYANINKICSTFFSRNENVAFIGITLLQAAKKERNFQRKEELLKQAIDHLISQPLNIDLNVVPQLLIDNGNYSSLADLTLRKIKALEHLSNDQRERLMSDAQYNEALNQCYSIIISLFAAIDQSISKEGAKVESQQDSDYIAYFLQKLNTVTNTELKIGLRDKILKRIEQFNDEVVLTALFEYLIGKPSTLLNVDNLPQMSPKTLNRIFDEALKADTIKGSKFDSIVKILLKKQDAERLCTITINAALDKYTISTEAGLTKLPLDKKVQLLSTAKKVLDLQKDKLSPESVKMLDASIKQISDNLELQHLVIQNIGENIQIISDYAKLYPEQQTEARKVELLGRYLGELEYRYHDQRQLLDIARRLQLFNVLLQYNLDPKTKEEEIELFAMINELVEFYVKYERHNLESLFAKYQLFSANQRIFRAFLLTIQSMLEQYETRQDLTYHLDQLIKYSTMRNTIFELLQYCVVSEVMSPFQIVMTFVPQFQAIPADQSIVNSVDARKIICLVKLFIEKSKQKRDQSFTNKFRDDIKLHGLKLYQIYVRIYKAIQDINQIFDPKYGDLFESFLTNLKLKFEEMLEFYQVIGIAGQQPEQQSVSGFAQQQQQPVAEIDGNGEESESEHPAFLESNNNSRQGESSLSSFR